MLGSIRPSQVATAAAEGNGKPPRQVSLVFVIVFFMTDKLKENYKDGAAFGQNTHTMPRDP